MRFILFSILILSQVVHAGRAGGVLFSSQSKLMEDYNKAFKELDDKNKLVNKYYNDIKTCTEASGKAYEEERKACGSISATDFIKQKKESLYWASQTRADLSKKYDDIISKNPNVYGDHGPMKPEDVSDALAYLDGKSKLQDARFTLEQKVNELEKKLNKTEEAYKNFFQGQSFCQKVSSCSAVKKAVFSANQASEAVRALSALTTGDTTAPTAATKGESSK